MKKIFIFLILGILLVSSMFFILKKDITQEDILKPTSEIVKTAQGNIIKEYSPSEKTIRLKDIETKAETLNAKLDTPQDYKVTIGYKKVGQFTINSKQDKDNILGKFELYDKRKNDATIERQIGVKYLTTQEVEENVYDSDCSLSANGTEICGRIIVGTQIVEKDVWLPFNNNVKSNEEIVIGLFTDVQVRDKVEWIPTIFGVRIDEWATWTATSGKGGTGFENGELNDTSTYGITFTYSESGTDTSTQRAYVVSDIAHTGNYSVLVNTSVTRGGIINRTTVPLQDHQISLWVNTNKTGNDGALDIWSGTDRNGTYMAYALQQTSDCTNGRICTYDGSSWVESSYNYTANTWAKQIIIVNSSGTYFFYNNLSAQIRYIASVTSIGTVSIGSKSGHYDDIWFGEEEAEILITLLDPENTANFTINTINFSANISDSLSVGIQNVTLKVVYPNGTLFYNNTNASGFEGVYNWTDIILSDGNWNWSIIAYDDNNESYESGMRVFNINTTPFIQFENPTPTNYYNSSSSYVPVNVSLTETYFDNITFSFYNDTLTEFYYEDSTRFINESLADGIYNYNVTVWTTTAQTNTTETRNIIIDTTAPEVVLLAPPLIIDFHSVNTNLSVNWSANDTNIDTCILQFEGSNRTVTCSDNQTEINITNSINRSIIFYVNDTFGNMNSISRSWNYIVFENSQTFNNETFEGVINTFIANVTIIESNSITIANLIYNGTSYSNSFSQSGNDSILTIDFLVPNVGTDTNLTFFWSLTLLGGQIINLTSHNQTIISLSLDDCSVNTVVLYNYTVIDEGNQSLLSNTTTELNINLLDTLRQNYIVNFSKKYLETNPFAVCINKNLSSSTYAVDSIVKYEATGYAVEYYNIINATITNSTIPEEITLYDLFSEDSTEFKITFKAEDFTFVEDALIYIDRQYIAENNTFKTVELPKTDSNGQTVGHFVRNEVVYNIRVIKDGVVLGNFKNIIAFCEDYTIGNCQMVLEATPEDLVIFDYDAQLGIIFQTLPAYNENTSSISFDFSTDDGTIKTVSMDVTRDDIFGNRSICNNTLTSSSGTLICSFDPNIDDSVLRVGVSVDGQPVVLSSVRLESSDYGNLGYVLWFFLTFLFILLFAHSKTEVLIGLGISSIGAISLGITRGDIIGLGSAGIWILVIIILGILKLNKERPQ